MTFVLSLVAVVAALTAGVLFSEKIKTWVKVKSADAVATTIRDVKAEEAKIVDKLP